MEGNLVLIKKLTDRIHASFLKRQDQTNKKLDQILDSKIKKADYDIEKYSMLLKYNIIFYKTLSRNTEALVEKWIMDGYIPDINEFNEQVKFITSRSREYINEVMKEGPKRFKDSDRTSFFTYDELDDKIKRQKIEKDYKVLNLYKDLLNVALKEICKNKDDYNSILDANSREIRNALKKGIIKCVDETILDKKDIDSNNGTEQHKEEYDDKNYLSVNEKPDKIQTPGSIESIRQESYAKEGRFDSKFIELLDEVDRDSIREHMGNIYSAIKDYEDISDSNLFGFGRDSVAEFASASLLLNILEGEDYRLVKDVITLVAIGEVGEGNFSDIMKEIITDRNIISLKSWDKSVTKMRLKLGAVSDSRFTGLLMMPSEKFFDSSSVYLKLKSRSSSKTVKEEFNKSDDKSSTKRNRKVSDLSREIEAVKDYQIEEYKKEKERQKWIEESESRTRNRDITSTGRQPYYDERTAKIFFNDVENLDAEKDDKIEENEGFVGNIKKGFRNILNSIKRDDDFIEDEFEDRNKTSYESNAEDENISFDSSGDGKLFKSITDREPENEDDHKLDNRGAETEFGGEDRFEGSKDDYSNVEYEEERVIDGDQLNVKGKISSFLNKFKIDDEDEIYEDEMGSEEEKSDKLFGRGLNISKFRRNEEDDESTYISVVEESEEKDKSFVENSKILSYGKNEGTSVRNSRMKTLDELIAEVREEKKSSDSGVVSLGDYVKSKEVKNDVEYKKDIGDVEKEPLIFNTKKDIEVSAPITNVDTKLEIEDEQQTESGISEQTRKEIEEKIEKISEEAKSSTELHSEENNITISEKTEVETTVDKGLSINKTDTEATDDVGSNEVGSNEVGSNIEKSESENLNDDAINSEELSDKDLSEELSDKDLPKELKVKDLEVEKKNVERTYEEDYFNEKAVEDKLFKKADTEYEPKMIPPTRLGPDAVSSDKKQQESRAKEIPKYIPVVVPSIEDMNLLDGVKNIDDSEDKSVSEESLQGEKKQVNEVINKLAEDKLGKEVAENSVDKHQESIKVVTEQTIDNNNDSETIMTEKTINTDGESEKIITETKVTKISDIGNYDSDNLKDESSKSSKVIRNVIIAAALLIIVAGAYVFTIKNQNKFNIADFNNKEKQSMKAKEEKESDSKVDQKAQDKKEEQEAKEEQEIKEDENSISPTQKELDARKKMTPVEKKKSLEKYKDGKGTYFVVYAGTDTSKDSSEYTAQKYKNMGVDVKVIESEGLYKMISGEYKTPQEATENIQFLGSKGIDAYAVKRDKYYDLKLQDFKEDINKMKPQDKEKAYEELKKELDNEKGFKNYKNQLDIIYNNSTKN